MSRLYLRLPSKTAAERATHGRGLVCAYALTASSGRVEREGIAALSELSATLSEVERVVLLLAASDVTLLRLQVPPLSPARLKAALPNLVEEHLISDPAECVIVAGVASEGRRTVAVMQRAWLESIAKTLHSLGARSMVGVPAQLCLPWRTGTVSAAVDSGAEEMELTLRTSEQEGIGLPMAPDASAGDLLQSLSALAPDAPVTLHLPDRLLEAHQSALRASPELAQRVALARNEWPIWLGGAETAGLNLLAGLGAGYGGPPSWRKWRWPIALAAGVLAINLIGLWADWWRLKSEADGLRAGMIQTFKSAYPKEGVILDPIAQMKQKNAAAQRAAGQPAADDFMALAAGFAEAWAGVAQPGATAKAPGIAALEYRDGSLVVRPKADADSLVEQLKVALAARSLSLTQPAAGVWQIRSGK